MRYYTPKRRATGARTQHKQTRTQCPYCGRKGVVEYTNMGNINYRQCKYCGKKVTN